MKQLHALQLQVLKALIYSQGLKFSDIKTQLAIQSNQVTFHLDKLVEQGLIFKDEDMYRLTAHGKEYANTMDTGELRVKKQAKLGAMICCTREEEDGSWSILIHTRHKQPFWGKQGFLTGKIHWGENPLNTAERELKEESNLDGKAILVKVLHYLEYDKETDVLLDDKYLYFSHVHNPTGEVQSSIEGLVERVNEKDIASYLRNPYRSVEDFMELYASIKKFDGTISFQEYTRHTSDF